MTLLTMLAALGTPAFAQDAPEVPEASAAPTPEVSAQLRRLESELAAARAGGARSEAELVELSWRLDRLAVMLDPRQALEDRVQAAGELGAVADPALIPFLNAALSAGPLELKIAAVAALMSTPEPEVAELAAAVLRRGGALELRSAAIALLGVVPTDEAGEALYAFVEAEDSEEVLREDALAALESGHPELLELRGVPRPPTPKAGGDALLGVAANGVAGGILLSSIGVWGQTDAGIAIGAVGGALVGVGTGATYAFTRPVTPANSLQYTAGVGWGLELGVISSLAVYGDRYPEHREEVSAGFRALGVGLGAGAALSRFKADVSTNDVLELNLSTLLGQQLGFGAAHLALDQGYGYETAFELETSPRMAAALAGTAAGATAGWLLRDRWTLEGDDLAFAATTGLELLWLGSWLPIAIDDRGHQGAPRFAWAAGTSAALAFAEWQQPSMMATGTMGYGFLAGTAVGAGAPLLAGATERQTAAAALLAGGLLGGAGGYLVGDRLDMQSGDYATVAVGLPITVGELAVVTYILADRDLLGDDLQAPGLMLVGSGLGAAGLLGVSQLIDPSTGEAVVAGSAAVWGAWYGLLVPLALDAPLEGSDYGISALAAGDAFLAAAIVAQSDLVGLQPRRTLLPQLGGVGGATLGALGAALFTDERQAVAGGAVVGSLLGFGGGALAEARFGADRSASLGAPLGAPTPRAPDLPGKWSFSAAPAVMADGELGGQLSVSAVGW